MADAAQTVVEKTEDQAKPGTEGTDARKSDDLDTLLAEYAAGTKTPASKPETKTDTSKDDPAIVKRLTELEQREANRQFQQDMKPAIVRVRGNIDPALYDDDDVRDWIDRQAVKDPRLQQAWLARHEDPDKYNRVLDGLGKKLQERFSKVPDKAATEDRAAVTAAVRGASQKAPEGKAPDYSGKSDAEFAKDVQEKYGFRPL